MNDTATKIPVGDVGAGHTLGRYELLIPIASGGMAMVWAARLKGSRGFQKIVAVKTMLPKLSEDPQFERMFLDEASLASQVRHPHVVEIMDLGEQDGVLFLVMEWIEGTPLSTLIKAARQSGGIPLPIAVRIAMQACAGLHAAHELRDGAGELVGLVHRDVSPQNLLVTYDGVTKVVDFGVAKASGAGGFNTQGGQIKGKLAYMAPEQIHGETIDRRVDVFALGIVLYAMTTGKHPFRKESDAATLYRICSPEPAMSPRKVVPGYPLPLERVVMQALAKDPAHRFKSANELLVALDRALPASMRASSDQPVADFVKKLAGGAREEQKVRLAAALDRADKKAAETATLREVLESQPPPSRASLSGISDVSSVTDVTGRPSGETSAVVGITRPDVSEVPGLGGAPPKKSRVPLLLAGVAVLAGAAVAAAVVLGRRAPPAPAAAQPASVEPATPAATAEPTPTPTPSAPEATVAPSAAPEPSAAPSAKPGAKRWVPGPAAAPSPAAASKPAPGKKPGLSVDKDFQ
ncbi:MAG: serine/threonine protein kinase [Myxococcales bacterium]|nr:serine/threonine protein kinase [Myxococcales bacterium]